MDCPTIGSLLSQIGIVALGILGALALVGCVVYLVWKLVTTPLRSPFAEERRSVNWPIMIIILLMVGLSVGMGVLILGVLL